METGSKGCWRWGGWWGEDSDKSRFLFTGVARISQKRFLLAWLNEELLFRLAVPVNASSPLLEWLRCSRAHLSVIISNTSTVLLLSYNHHHNYHRHSSSSISSSSSSGCSSSNIRSNSINSSSSSSSNSSSSSSGCCSTSSLILLSVSLLSSSSSSSWSLFKKSAAGRRSVLHCYPRKEPPPTHLHSLSSPSDSLQTLIPMAQHALLLAAEISNFLGSWLGVSSWE